MEGHLLAFLDNNNQVMLWLSSIILYKSDVTEITKKTKQKKPHNKQTKSQNVKKKPTQKHPPTKHKQHIQEKH